MVHLKSGLIINSICKRVILWHMAYKLCSPIFSKRKRNPTPFCLLLSLLQKRDKSLLLQNQRKTPVPPYQPGNNPEKCILWKMYRSATGLSKVFCHNAYLSLSSVEKIRFLRACQTPTLNSFWRALHTRWIGFLEPPYFLRHLIKVQNLVVPNLCA